MKEIKLETAALRIAAARDVHIFCHKNPDGDTLGSAFALWAFLRSRGVRTAVRCTDPIGSVYDFLTDEYSEEEFEPACRIAVDCSDINRLGSYSTLVFDVCIDHHGSQTFFANETWVDAASASCSEMILQLLERLDAQLTQYICDALYAGMSTDTGCFRFGNTTAATHMAAARLIALGARHTELNRQFFMQKTRARVALERAVYNSLDFRCGGQLAIVALTRSVLDETGAQPDDLDGLSDMPRCVQGVEIGVTIREEENYNKASLRSTHVDISGVCRSFGGGGHAFAAGFESTLPIPELIEQVAQRCEAALNAR